MTKLESYLEQVKYCARDGRYTAQAFLKAVDKTGDVSDITDTILIIAETHGIPKTDLAELAEKSAVIQAQKRRQAGKETLADIGKRCAELSVKADITQADIDTIAADLHTQASALAAVNTNKNTSAFITADKLMSKEFDPINWIIDGMICRGLTILSGGPKIGKSWLMLSLSQAASCGGCFLGSLKVTQTPVLHLALEETERSVYERRKILARKSGGFDSLGNLTFGFRWDTGVNGLEAYLREHREIRLVIIDTLGRFFPDVTDFNDYASTVTPMSSLKRIADDLDIAIIAVHHTKKSGAGKGSDWLENILGSQGIVGSADAILYLSRSIAKDDTRLNTGKLYATGRTIKELDHALAFDPDIGTWTVTNTPKPKENVTKGKKTTRVYNSDDGTYEDVEFTGGCIL